MQFSYQWIETTVLLRIVVLERLQSAAQGIQSSYLAHLQGDHFSIYSKTMHMKRRAGLHEFYSEDL